MKARRKMMFYECCMDCPKRRPACSSDCPEKEEADRQKEAYKATQNKLTDVHAYIKGRHENIEKKVRNRKG